MRLAAADFFVIEGVKRFEDVWEEYHTNHNTVHDPVVADAKNLIICFYIIC